MIQVVNNSRLPIPKCFQTITAELELYVLKRTETLYVYKLMFKNIMVVFVDEVDRFETSKLAADLYNSRSI